MGKAINIAGGTLTAKDHAVINHCLKDNSIGIGAGFGNEMSHRLDSVNEIAILDGFAMVQGRCYVIYPGDEEKLIVRSGSQGMKRHDLIVIEFDNALEKMDLKVLEGIESSDPVDPEVTQDDTLGGGNLYQMPLYRILVDGLNVEVEDIREYMGGAVGKNIDLAVTTFNTPNVSFMVEDGDKENTIRFTNGVKLEGGGGGMELELLWTNSNIARQDAGSVSLDLSSYRWVDIVSLRYERELDNTIHTLTPKGFNQMVVSSDGWRRTYTVTDSGVSWGVSPQSYSVIPYQVYGLK